MDFTEVYPDTCSTLNLAAHHGNVDIITKLLSEGKSPNCRDNRGWVAIHYAVAGEHSEAIKLLLQHDDVDVNSETFEGETPLQLHLCRRPLGSPPVAELIAQILLEAGANPNSTRKHAYRNCLSSAISVENISLVKLLLDHGADVNAFDDCCITPLHAVAKQGHAGMEILDLLMTKPLTLVLKPHSPLHILAASPECSLPLLQKFLSLPGGRTMINSQDENGNTPLLISCSMNRYYYPLGMMEFLLDIGADPNIRNHQNELPVTVIFQNPNCVDLLGNREIDRVFDLTCISEIKKSRFTGIGFYLYIILRDKKEVMQHAVKWHPNLRKLSYSACDWFIEGLVMRDKVKMSLDLRSLYYDLWLLYKEASLLGAACSSCTTEIGYNIVDVLIEAGCSINPDSERELPAVVMACIEAFPAAEEYKFKVIERLILAGASLTAYNSCGIPTAFLYAMIHQTSFNILEFLFTVVPATAVFLTSSFDYIEKEFLAFVRAYVCPTEDDMCTHFVRLLTCLNRHLYKLPSSSVSLIFVRVNSQRNDIADLMKLIATPKRLTHLSALRIREILYERRRGATLVSRLIDHLCEKENLPLPVCQWIRLQRS